MNDMKIQILRLVKIAMARQSSLSHDGKDHFSETDPVAEDVANEIMRVVERSTTLPGSRRDPLENHDIDSVILETSQDADDLLRHLHKLVRRFGFLSKSDLYEAIGIAPTYVDTRWGWRDLQSAKVVEIEIPGGKTGYRLVLPEPHKLITTDPKVEKAAQEVTDIAMKIMDESGFGVSDERPRPSNRKSS